MCSSTTLAYFTHLLILGGLVVGRWWMLLVGPACWLLFLYSCALIPGGASRWLGHYWMAAMYVALGLATRYVMRVFRPASRESGEAPVSRWLLIAIFAVGALGFQLGLHTYLYLSMDRAAATSESPFLVAPIGGFSAVACGWIAAFTARSGLIRRPETQRQIAGRAVAYLLAMAAILVAVYAHRTGDAGSVGPLLLIVLAWGAVSTAAAPFFVSLWVGKSVMDLAAMALVALVAVAPLLLLIWSASRATDASRATA